MTSIEQNCCKLQQVHWSWWVYDTTLVKIFFCVYCEKKQAMMLLFCFPRNTGDWFLCTWRDEEAGFIGQQPPRLGCRTKSWAPLTGWRKLYLERFSEREPVVLEESVWSSHSTPPCYLPLPPHQRAELSHNGWCWSTLQQGCERWSGWSGDFSQWVDLREHGHQGASSCPLS